MRLDQGVALITGAGSGIGRATATRLAEDGASVLCHDVDRPAAEETAERIRASGGQAAAAVGDVRDRAATQEAVALAVERFGRLTYLVNNAGLVTMHGLDELTEEAWDLVLDVNLKGQFLTAQTAAPAIADAGGGAIVNLSTVESEVVVASGPHCQPHYNASKGGVKMLTKALAHELAPMNIRVNAVAPGPVATGFTGGDLRSEEALAFLRTRMLFPRPIEPAEVGGVISFLLSDEAAMVTGIQLPIDGGWLVH